MSDDGKITPDPEYLETQGAYVVGCIPEKWTVIVEVDGNEVSRISYGDLAAAQMMEEGARLYYRHHDKAGINVNVRIEQD